MRFLRFLVPLLALCFLAAASKPKLTIRFHTEANSNSGSSFATSAPMPGSSTPVSISKVADISESDVASVYPFKADDGSMGCMLKLDEHGTFALDSLSQQYHGSLLLGFVNGRPVTAMVIDRRVSDGIISIARGLTPAEIALMKKAYPTREKKNTKSASTGNAPVNNGAPVITVPPPLPTSVTGSGPRGD